MNSISSRLLLNLFLIVELALCAPLAVAAVSLSATLIDAKDATLIASDGTAFVVTSARVKVPQRRAAPDAAAIELAVVRVRRAGNVGGNAHVMLAGGPGDSGVRLALDMARRGGAALSGFIDGDLIGIDQRGIGGSTPSLLPPVRYGLPLEAQGSVATWLPIIEAATRTVAAEMRRRGIDLQAYNTEESADDVAAVGQVLGYGQMTLWGRSYGTHLALATARRHPAMVKRMILVSPLGPDHKWKLPSQVDLVMGRIGERAGAPRMTAQLREIVDRLGRAPVRVALPDPATQKTVNVVIVPCDVQWVIAQVIGDPRALATLPAAVHEMHGGDFRRVAQMSLALRPRLGIISAMNHMMNLSSGESGDRKARIKREAGSALLGDAINFPGRYLGPAWGARALDGGFNEPVTGAVPTLILAGDLDARTPVENGREIAATLSAAKLVVVENAAHEFNVFGNQAIRALLGGFVRGEAIVDERVVLPPLRFEKVPAVPTEAP
ncbi:alpha/beta fold hydrolase [Massilia glaciei]|nr:alpha/beta fold hydrolase [Massilia glaciei]